MSWYLLTSRWPIDRPPNNYISSKSSRWFQFPTKADIRRSLAFQSIYFACIGFVKERHLSFICSQSMSHPIQSFSRCHMLCYAMCIPTAPQFPKSQPQPQCQTWFPLPEFTQIFFGNLKFEAGSAIEQHSETVTKQRILLSTEITGLLLCIEHTTQPYTMNNNKIMEQRMKWEAL